MKNRTYLFILFVFAFSLSSKAQIGNEIKAFIDSTEILVNNGRKMLVQKIVDGNYEKAAEVYHYLKDETKDEKFAAFYYTEELYLDFLLSDWPQWIEKASNYAKYSRSLCYPDAFKIGDILYSELAKKADFFSSLIPTLNVDPEARDVMAIYIHFLKIGKRDDGYNQMVKNFHKNYKNSRFDEFFKRYLPDVAVKSSWSIAMGTAGLFPTGKLADGFSSNMGFGMSMEFNFGKVYVSLNMQGSPLRLKTPFDASNKDVTWNFEKDEKFQYFQGGLSVGYFLVRSQHYHFAPFVSIGGAELLSNRYEDSDDDDKEFKIFNSFFYGPGIHTEIRLKQFNVSDQLRFGGTPIGYLSLKLNGGYNLMTGQKYDMFKGNMAWFSLGLVLGLGDF